MSGEAPPRGLPEHLPAGEVILWQASPQGPALARAAFHSRHVAIYFALLTILALGVALLRGTAPWGAVATAAGGCGAVALLRLLAWAQARTAVYTLTNRRIVLRIGAALPTSINLPLPRIAAVDLSSGGDVVLTLADTPALGWIVLWPHARPWRLARPQPMLRCLADAEDAAIAIAQACLAAAPAEPARPAAAVPPPAMIPVAA